MGSIWFPAGRVDCHQFIVRHHWNYVSPKGGLRPSIVFSGRACHTTSEILSLLLCNVLDSLQDTWMPLVSPYNTDQALLHSRHTLRGKLWSSLKIYHQFWKYCGETCLQHTEPGFKAFLNSTLREAIRQRQGKKNPVESADSYKSPFCREKSDDCLRSC